MFKKIFSFEPLESRKLPAITAAYAAHEAERVDITPAQQDYLVTAEVRLDTPPDVLYSSPFAEQYLALATVHAHVESTSATGEFSASASVRGFAIKEETDTLTDGDLRWREALMTAFITGRGPTRVSLGFTTVTSQDTAIICCNGYMDSERNFEGVTGSLTIETHGPFEITIVAHAYFFETDWLHLNLGGHEHEVAHADRGFALFTVVVNASRYTIEAYGRTRVKLWDHSTLPAEADKFAHGEINVPRQQGAGVFQGELTSESIGFEAQDHVETINHYTVAGHVSFGRGRSAHDGNIVAMTAYDGTGQTDIESLRRRRGSDLRVDAVSYGLQQGNPMFYDDVLTQIEFWKFRFEIL